MICEIVQFLGGGRRFAPKVTWPLWERLLDLRSRGECSTTEIESVWSALCITLEQCRPGRHQPKHKSNRKSNRNIEPKGEWIGVEFGLASLPPLGTPQAFQSILLPILIRWGWCFGFFFMLLLLFGCLCDTTYEQAVSVQVSQGEILAFFVGLLGMLYYKFALWKTKRPPQKRL